MIAFAAVLRSEGGFQSDVTEEIDPTRIGKVGARRGWLYEVLLAINTRVRAGSLRAREVFQHRLREMQTEHRAPGA
jgi:hypothetical protein